MKRTTYEFKSGETVHVMDLTKAGEHRDAVEERIFRYGLRIFNDSANSAKARHLAQVADGKVTGDFDQTAYVNEMLAEFYAGKVAGERASGVDELTKEFRNLVVADAVKAGAGKYNRAKVLETVKDKGWAFLVGRVAAAYKMTPEAYEEARSAVAKEIVKKRSAGADKQASALEL